MIRNLTCYFSLLLIAVFAGCDSADPDAQQPANNPLSASKVTTDPILLRDLSVIKVEEKSSEGSLIAVMAELQNNTYKAREFNYRFTWLKADGSEINSPPPLWKSGLILAQERIYLKGVAPYGTVVDFRLDILARETYQTTEAKKK
ncbi:MAG: YcfL family protein [Verrucomicrobiota bacterium]